MRSCYLAGVRSGQGLQREQAAPGGTPRPCGNDPARLTQRSHLGDRCGFPMTDGGLLRQGSWAGLLQANRATIRPASLPANQHVFVLAPPLPGK